MVVLKFGNNMMDDRFTEITSNHMIGFVLLFIVVLLFAILFTCWDRRSSRKELEKSIEEFNKETRRVKMK